MFILIYDSVRTVPTPPTCIWECVTAELLIDMIPILLILIYYTPSYSLLETKRIISGLTSLIRSVFADNEDVTLLGDFNLPNLDWKSGTLHTPITNKNPT